MTSIGPEAGAAAGPENGAQPLQRIVGVGDRSVLGRLGFNLRQARAFLAGLQRFSIDPSAATAAA